MGLQSTKQTHTILGSRSQRGLTQLALDVLFRSIGPNMLESTTLPSVLDSLQACDSSEAALASAPYYLESVYADPSQASRAASRATTPMIVRAISLVDPTSITPGKLQAGGNIPCAFLESPLASPKVSDWSAQPKKLFA